MNWKTRGATSVLIDQGIGSVPTTGSRTVMPQTTTTYTLTAVGKDSNVVRQVTVNVLSASYQPPSKPTPLGPQTAETRPVPELNLPRATPTPAPETRTTPALPIPTPQEQEAASVPQPTPQIRPEYIPSTPTATSESGELHCPGVVPPYGQIPFENLPAGVLHFDRDALKNWSFILRPQLDGRQRLILVSKLPTTNDGCTIKWTVTR